MNRNHRDLDQSDSEAIEVNQIDDEDNMEPVDDEESGEDLDNNVNNDYRAIPELDRYDE